MSDKKPEKKNGPQPQRFLAAAAILAFALLIFGGSQSANTTAAKPVALTVLQHDITKGFVTKATLDDNDWQITVTLKDKTQLVSGYPDPYSPVLLKELSKANVATTVVAISSSPLWRTLLSTFFPLLLIGGLGFYLIRTQGQGIKRFGAGRGEEAKIPDTRFSDVAGAPEAVEELRELVDILKDPERFAKAGARVPKGVLLVGPPGTGKTLMARALAGEAGVPFFPVSGSDFVEAFVGVGASRVRDIFTKASKLEKAIIFIDEIDAIGKSRVSGQTSGATEERENTLNQLLVEMDGFTKYGVIVIGATNRPDVLDSALTRAGRFDRQITVPLPDWRGRLQILELLSRHLKFDPSANLESIARRTTGLSGADLEYLVNEAALEAVRASRVQVTGTDLARALETNQIGKARLSAVMTERDREIVAWHEAGHAVMGLCSSSLPDPVTVSIIPRGDAGGVTWTEESENVFVPKSQSLATLGVLLAGRAAELLLLNNDMTQGASNDLKVATRLATSMVAQYGMTDLGLAVASSSTDQQIAHQIRNKVNEMLAEGLERALDTLRENLELVGNVVTALLAEDTIDAPAIQNVKKGLSPAGDTPIERNEKVAQRLAEIRQNAAA